MRRASLLALLSGCALFHPEPIPSAPAPLPLAADREVKAPLAVRWIGHATTLVRMGEVEVVTDPYLRERLAGMPRLRPAGLAPGEMPRPRAVVVSHLHFDHCDLESLAQLAGPEVTLVLPAGAARQLPPVGFGRVVELSPWEWVDLPDLKITAIPVDHFGGRYGADAWMDYTYTGYVLEAAGRRVIFAGDTGYESDWPQQVGKRFPGADLALVPIAPYRESGRDSPIHVGPSGALRIFGDLGALNMIPIHFETFFSARTLVPVTEPRTLLRALAAVGGIGDRVWDLYPGETLALDREIAWRLSSDAGRAQSPAHAPPAKSPAPPSAGGGAGVERPPPVNTPFSVVRAAGPVAGIIGRALPSTTLRVTEDFGLAAGVSWELEPVSLTFLTMAGPQLHWLGAPLATRATASLGLHLTGGAGAGPVLEKTLWGAAELRGTAGWEDLTGTLGAGWYARGGGPFLTMGLASFDGIFGVSLRAPLRQGTPWLLTQEIVWH